jgi:hypothetical protein
MAQVDATYMQYGHIASIPVELTDRLSSLPAMGPAGSGGGEQNPHARAYAEA